MKTGFHVDPIYATHETPAAHPERPERIRCLLDLDVEGVERVRTERRATRDELSLVHSAGHLDSVEETASEGYSALDPDTYTSPQSHAVALRAAGAVLDTVDRVVEGSLDNGFVAVRPPGHHAETGRAMGFCLYSNIALAARYLARAHGVTRVLVADYDVHHGNGTQEILYRDAGALFVSVHQHPFYPGTGDVDEVGEDDGRGLTVNIPYPGGAGDSEYLAAFERVVIPVAREFAPEFVLLSAGFDAHRLDPLGGMRVETEGFARMTSMLLDVAAETAGGRFVAVLEGGYDLDALRACSTSVLECLTGRGPRDAADPATPAPVAERVLDAVIATQREFWKL